MFYLQDFFASLAKQGSQNKPGRDQPRKLRPTINGRHHLVAFDLHEHHSEKLATLSPPPLNLRCGLKQIDYSIPSPPSLPCHVCGNPLISIYLFFQARSERATIRSHIILDPLINPPSDVKTRMCREYLKQMGLRHVRAVAEYVKTVNHMADVHMGTKRRVGIISRRKGRGGGV